MTALTVFIEGIGLLGPGLNNWSNGRAILAGRQAYQASKTMIPAPELLPAAERRRASDIVKLTLTTSLEAITAANLPTTNLATVFSFSNGDGQNCHSICEMLASDDRQISPIRFHNSVHNAAAGYWSIATKTMATSSVLCAFDASFGAGLLDALTQVVVEHAPCALMVSDTPYPEPVFSKRPLSDNCGIALVLAPLQTKQSMAKITLSVTHDAADRLQDPVLEQLRATLPSGRGLPLLQAIAQQKNRRVVIDYLDNMRLAIVVEPC